MVLALLTGFLRATPARAEDPAVPPDRALVVNAWKSGGMQVRAAAEIALLGTDAQVSEFLNGGLEKAQRFDELDAVAGVVGEGGPSVRAAAKQALDAADAGDLEAVSAFLSHGWQGPSDIDTRLSVNQVMAVGGDQVREAAQQALDSENPAVMRAFLDSGWQLQWQTDQRLRINQAMATGGPQVRAAGQKALDAGTPEALETFLAYGWSVAAAQDEEVATLTGLLAQAQAAGEVAARETKHATQEADRAKAASDAARRAAADAARATEAARSNMKEAAAQARRAAVAAQKAAQAAKVAVQAAAAASRAARAASTAAARAASAASKAGQAATKAYKAAADAATDRTKAADARAKAEQANAAARDAEEFAKKADAAGKAIEAGRDAVAAAKSAAAHARSAAAANDDAARHANSAGADAREAVAAANQARANADRATRAAAAAEKYLQVAINAAYAARDAAKRAAVNARAAAQAAIFAADHAGEAAEAARRATEYANAATQAATDAVNAGVQAAAVYEAAREADVERLAVSRDQGLEAAQAANTEYESQQRAGDWDVEQAAKRDAETRSLIAEVQNPATAPARAVAASRQVALNLTSSRGAWTQQAAMAALAGSDEQAVAFVRTGLAATEARDNRQAVMDLAITENTALRDAALAALAGSDAVVAQFLRTQNYPGRYTQDRLKVNQILAAARTAGDVVLEQKAQEALDADTLQALRDFLDTGQYTAAAIGERVRVNQVIADPASGPELKAAAQIALDGPAPGLREFLESGRYIAAERDYDNAIHLTVVGSLLERINEVAETAVTNSFEAQAVAARARNDAALAEQHARDALLSADKAEGYANKARGYASQAAQSVQKAAAAVATAKDASTRANASARSAIRSAAWAVASHKKAIKAAAEANAAAKRAYDSARAAGEDANAAVAAAKQAYDTYSHAQGLEIAKCHTEYAADPIVELERILSGTQHEWYRNCVANVVPDPAELANRAYTNAALCDIYPQGSQLYQNCIHSTLDPEFKGMQPLIFFVELVKGLVATLAPVGALAIVLCVATVVCGAVAGTLLTVGEVGLNVYKLINGDQTLAQTLLKLGQTALETLVFLGAAKLISAGFQSARALYIANQNAKKAQAELKAVNAIRLKMVEVTSCLWRGSAVTLAGVALLAPVGASTATAPAPSVVHDARQISLAAPQSAPGCGVETVREAEYEWRHPESRSLFDAYLDDKGGLWMLVEVTEGSPVRGRDIFIRIMSLFGSRVKTVEGNLVDSNKDSFAAALAAGKTPTEAAWATWTGKMAREHGYTKILHVDQEVFPDKPVRITFGRP